MRRRIADEAPARLLDIPCGPGIDLEGLRKDGVEVGNYVGCDTAMNFLRFCKSRFQSAEFLCCSAERLPFRDGSMDVVSSKDLLEHLPAGAERALGEMLRVCSQKVILSWFIPPKGTATRMSVKYPYSNPLHRLYVLLFGLLIGEIQYNVYSRAEIERYLKNSGAAVGTTTTVGYNFNHEPCEVWEISPGTAAGLHR